MTEKQIKQISLLREHAISMLEILNAEPPDENQAGTTTVSYSANPEPSTTDYRHDPTLVITDVQDAGMALVRAGKKEWVSKLLADVFDASRISDLKRDQWEEFIDTCNTEAGR